VAVNLLAALDGERFGPAALARARAAAADAGYVMRRVDGSGDDALAAWIDLHFAPSWWSSEVRAGSAWIAARDGNIAGFAAFGARGLRFRWLRQYAERDEAGIFGPYGVEAAHRKTAIGAALLTAAVCSLREAGFAAALIPAVAGERLIAMYVRRTGAVVADEFAYDDGRRFRTTILASGAGTNARNVLEHVRRGRLPLDVSAIIANHAGAGVLDTARDHGVAAHALVWHRAQSTRAEYDARLGETLAATEPDLVLLLGWMHLLPPAFLERFPETINLHPSFLPLDPAADVVVVPDGSTIPALRGAHALRDALAGRVAWTGATVHYVTGATDRGAVLVRVPVPVGDATTEEALRERVRPAEFDAVPAAIRRWTFER
jgi:phosphoribosylglycinamide formyltransferase-1